MHFCALHKSAPLKCGALFFAKNANQETGKSRQGIAEIEGKAARESGEGARAATEWSRGDASEIDRKTERSIVREHMSQFQLRKGMSEIEGKATTVGASECTQ